MCWRTFPCRSCGASQAKARFSTFIGCKLETNHNYGKWGNGFYGDIGMQKKEGRVFML